MKIVFMGTPDFASGVLEAIIAAGHEIVLVVTQEDKPKGRGKEISYTPVKETAIKHGLTVFQPHRIRNSEAVLELKKCEADIFVVVAYGQILSKEILDMPKYGCVNVHASLLPKYRGAAPIQWAVIDGEKYTGITTMKMDEGIDTGDIIETATYELKSDETGGSLFDNLMEIGGKLMVSTLDKLEKGTATFTKQDDSKSTYAKMLNKQLGRLDFSMDAEALERLIRGLNPWPSAYTTFGGKTLKIWRAEVLNGDFEGEYGEIVKVSKDELIVKTGKGALSILELQLEGKKRMDIKDFLSGNKPEEGTIFGF
ncbi:MAG: methionyl-tRNA formyltransferase [Lachnospiraceae bacterium]|nr:methionyl-tRNA formyltransferase [Lachnospiraceae bacterium]